MANKHQNILYPASAVCFCMLLLGIIFPYSHASDAADAAEPVIDPATYGLALNLNSSVDINIDPSIAGKLQVETQSIGIKANSPNGYQLLFAVDGNDNNIYLNGETTADKTKTIYATNSADLALSSDRFAQWGYSTTSTTSFSALPTTGNEVQLNSKTSSTSGDFDVTTINYGIKANLGLSSGAYTTRINYIAISNVADVLYAAAIAEGKKEFSPADVAAGSATTIVATGLAMTGKALTPSDLTVKIGTTTVPTADITITQQLPNLILNVKLPTTLTADSYAVTITLNNSHVDSNFSSYTIAKENGITIANPVTTFDAAFAAAKKSKVTAKDGKEYYQMQDMTASICSAVTAASSTAAVDTQIGTLVDNRGDKKTYTVAKLLDGNCWMTENLRLGGSSAITLTSSDSEVSSNFTLPAHVSSWTSTYTAAMIHVSDDIDTVTNQYYGYYYNYYAASAGTVTNSGTVNASASICPKGWTLPDNYTQTAGQSYSNLLHKYGVIANITDNSAYATDGYAKLTAAPLSFALSGRHLNSGTTVNFRGSFGYYWSGTSYSTRNAYYLYFSSSNVYPQYNYDKRYGSAIRCVAQ